MFGRVFLPSGQGCASIDAAMGYAINNVRWRTFGKPKSNRGDNEMQLELNDEEAKTLRAMLNAYLPDLRREVARTDAHDYRHELVMRRELCERLIAQLP
jgi:hypothetical protein